MADIKKYVIDLKEKDLPIEKIGGKALNLVKMSSAGFNIPPAFIVSVDAYDHFIKTELESEYETINKDIPKVIALYLLVASKARGISQIFSPLAYTLNLCPWRHIETCTKLFSALSQFLNSTSLLRVWLPLLPIINL